MKPNTVNVFGKVYRIEYKELEEVYGECKNKTALIEIDKNLDGQDLIHTLLHEYFHAVIHRLNISHVISDDVEEILCDCLATFLVDNHIVMAPKSEA